MTEVIAFNDAEALAITWLTPAKIDAPISTKVPDPRPTKFVKVTRTGGSQFDIVSDNPQLTFECWDATGPGAAALCSLVRAHFTALAGETVGGVYVRRVGEVGGPVNFPDPESDSPRYQYTASAFTRGQAI